MCTHIYICIHIHIYVCMYIYTYMCIYTYIYIYVYIYIDVYVYIHVCVYVYEYLMYMNMYVYNSITKHQSRKTHFARNIKTKPLPLKLTPPSKNSILRCVRERERKGVFVCVCVCLGVCLPLKPTS